MSVTHVARGMFAWLTMAVACAEARAQSTISGRVVTDSGGAPIRGAEIRVSSLHLVAMTDSLGKYALRSLPIGEHEVVTRALGFRPDTLVIGVSGNEAQSRDIRLRPAVTMLSEVRVRDSAGIVPAKLAPFFERRHARAGGHYLDSTTISRWESRRTADLFSTIPGVDVRRVGTRAYAASTRGPSGLRRGPCFMDVYVDGAPVGAAYDLNTVAVNQIAAIEVYAGPASVPAQYNRTSRDCGVVLVWTR